LIICLLCMTKLAERKRRRSATATCDICGERTLLVQHHIHGREVRGSEGKWNLAAICPNCHYDVHAVPPRIILEDWHMTTAGRKLMWHWVVEEYFAR
jgi:5-methylcytosine-specific restriction endonuclease McrA